MPSPIYQYMIKLVVSLPIRTGPGVCSPNIMRVIKSRRRK